MDFELLISGVSDRIGAQVLEQALRTLSISCIIALSRRPLPGLGCYANLEVVVLKDFTKYSEEVICQVVWSRWLHMVNESWRGRPMTADAQRCMTTTAGDPMLELQYPKAFANAYTPTLSDGKRFRYLHLTGAIVERNQARALWLKSNVRKMKVCWISLIGRDFHGIRLATRPLTPHGAKESYK